jgi:hypothetical protein
MPAIACHDAAGACARTGNLPAVLGVKLMCYQFMQVPAPGQAENVDLQKLFSSMPQLDSFCHPA